MLIAILYLFRAAMCPSSGELIVSIHLVYVTLYRWPFCVQVWMRRSLIQTCFWILWNSFPKRRHIKFRRRGNTRKMNTAKLFSLVTPDYPLLQRVRGRNFLKFYVNASIYQNLLKLRQRMVPKHVVRWSPLFVIRYIFNCSWVDTRWQEYSTHLHTNNT